MVQAGVDHWWVWIVLLLYEILLFLDYLQTREILRNPMYYEKNPIINWLTRDWCWTWFGLWMAAGVMMLLATPLWICLPFLIVGIVLEGYWVWHNHKIGIRIRGW